MVTIHSPGARERASSAMRSWMSRIERTGPSAGKIDLEAFAIHVGVAVDRGPA